MSARSRSPKWCMGINAFIARDAQGQPEASSRSSGSTRWFDPGKEARRRQGADRPGRRHHHAAHRLPGAAAGRRGARRARLRPGLRHDRLRAEGAAHRDRRQLGTVLHRARQGGDRRHLGDPQHLGGPEGGHGPDRALRPAVPAEAAQRGRSDQERDHRRQLHPFNGPIDEPGRRGRVAEGETMADEDILRWTTT